MKKINGLIKETLNEGWPIALLFSAGVGMFWLGYYFNDWEDIEGRLVNLTMRMEAVEAVLGLRGP